MRYARTALNFAKRATLVGSAGYGLANAREVEDDARRRQAATAGPLPGPADPAAHLEALAARRMSVATTHDAAVGFVDKFDPRGMKPTLSPWQVFETGREAVRQAPDLMRVMRDGTGHDPLDALIANRKVVSTKQTAIGLAAGMALGAVRHPVARGLGGVMMAATVVSVLSEIRRVHPIIKNVERARASGLLPPVSKPPAGGTPPRHGGHD